MIRRLLRGALRRALGDSPRAPAAPPAPPPAPPREEPEPPNIEVEGPELARWVSDGPVLLLDIRERVEVEGGFAEGSWLMPMNQVPHRLNELPKDRKIAVICAAGARSYGVAHYLREQGFPEAWSLAGGVGAYLDAGGRNVQTPQKAPFRLLDPVRIRTGAPGGGEAAIVQELRETGAGLRVAVRVAQPEGSTRIDDLRPEDLEPIAGGSTPAQRLHKSTSG